MEKGGISTKELDIVYFVRDGLVNEELRYSLRSLQNMPHNRVWIFGGCPPSIVPDVRIRVDQTGVTKWDKVKNMFLMACNNKELTDDFILFNDDFFVMQPMDELGYLHRGDFDEHIKVLEKNFGNKPSDYTRLLRACSAKLKKCGVEKPLSYELHVPFPFNKQCLKDVIEKFPDTHCTRTIYGNLYNVGGERASDVKVFNSNPSFDYKATKLLSTDDSIVNINNDVWRHIRKTFNKASEFEI